MAWENTKQKTISCRIPANIKARLDDICGEKCKTIGELMRDMIRETYPEPKQPAIPPPIPATKQTPIKTTTEATKPPAKKATKQTPIKTTTEATKEWDEQNTCEGCGKHFTGTEKEAADSYNKHVRDRMTNSNHPKIQAKYRKIFGNLY